MPGEMPTFLGNGQGIPQRRREVTLPTLLSLRLNITSISWQTP